MNNAPARPEAALQEAREARDRFFDAHVVDLGAGERRARPRPRGAWDDDECPAELASALGRELADTARMLLQATVALTEEKALTVQLRKAAQRLDAQLVALCASGRHPPQRPVLLEAQTQTQEGRVEANDGSVRAEHCGRECAGPPARFDGSCGQPQSLRAPDDNWADASCQIGWSDSVADKSCQAHDVEAALARIRWAARDCSRRRAAAGALKKVAKDAKHDIGIAEQVLEAVSAQCRRAQEQVAAAQAARQDFLERKLLAERQRERNFPELLLPMQPPMPEASGGGRKDGAEAKRAGCFGGKKGAGQRADIERKWELHTALLTKHATALMDVLRQALSRSGEAEDELHQVYVRNEEDARRQLSMWERMAGQCQVLEGLRNGASSREQVEDLVAERTVEQLQGKVLELQHELTEASREWQRQVEDLEARDRLCVQEDIEIRSRALAAEKALSITLERLRSLEREAAHTKTKARDKYTAEVLRLRKDLHRSKAAVAALSASLAFQQTCKPMVGVGKNDARGAVKVWGPAENPTADAAEITPVAFDSSVLEEQLGQLQVAMDLFSPEWRRELELRRSSNLRRKFALHSPKRERDKTDALGRATTMHAAVATGWAEGGRDNPQREARGGESWAFPLNLVDLETPPPRANHKGGSGGAGQVYSQARRLWARMQIIGIRHMPGIRLPLQEPFVTVEVDGQKVPSQSTSSESWARSVGAQGEGWSEVPLPPREREEEMEAGWVTSGEGVAARQYVFMVYASSVICVSMCHWTSGTGVAVKSFKGVLQVVLSEVRKRESARARVRGIEVESKRRKERGTKNQKAQPQPPAHTRVRAHIDVPLPADGLFLG